MQSRRTLIGSVSFLILATGIAQADITTFMGSVDEEWSEPENWDNGIPTAADRAVIPDFKTCHVDINAIADTIDVQGTLIIDQNKKLTLENNNINLDFPADHSKVDGLVQLDGSGAVLEFTLKNHRLTGGGEIRGLDNAARIDIEADITLTNRLTNVLDEDITGAMVIKGLTGGTTNGRFKNNGNVVANIDGLTLKLHADTVLNDTISSGSATWEARRGSALEFNGSHTTMKGDFVIECGEIVFFAHIRTCGEFVFDDGTIPFSPNDGNRFAYGSFSSSTGCSNPQNAGPSVDDCTNWEVDDSASPYTCGSCG